MQEWVDCSVKCCRQLRKMKYWKDSVVWEYTDNVAGDVDSAKEEAPKEMAVKRGQVCSLSCLVLPFVFKSVVNCGVYELVFLSSFLSYL